MTTPLPPLASTTSPNSPQRPIGSLHRARGAGGGPLGQVKAAAVPIFIAQTAAGAAMAGAAAMAYAEA